MPFISPVLYEKERAIALAATPGPWAMRDSDDGELEFYIDSEKELDLGRIWGGCSHLPEDDARFVATFNPQFVLGLLDRLERMGARCPCPTWRSDSD